MPIYDSNLRIITAKQKAKRYISDALDNVDEYMNNINDDMYDKLTAKEKIAVSKEVKALVNKIKNENGII